MIAMIRLSDRESQMLEMAARGMTDQAIANELGISMGTVSTYWGRVRIKMGPLSRPELVAQYVRAASEQSIAGLKKELEDAVLRQKESEEALSTMRELVYHAPEAVLFVDRMGVILEGNLAAGELLGVQPDSLPGTRVGKFIPQHLHERHKAHRDTFFAHPERTKMGGHSGVGAVRADGSEVKVTGTVSRAVLATGPVAVVILRAVD